MNTVQPYNFSGSKTFSLTQNLTNYLLLFSQIFEHLTGEVITFSHSYYSKFKSNQTPTENLFTVYRTENTTEESYLL